MWSGHAGRHRCPETQHAAAITICEIAPSPYSFAHGATPAYSAVHEAPLPRARVSILP